MSLSDDDVDDHSRRLLGKDGILNVLLEATQLDKEAHVYVRYGQEREAVKLWSTAVRLVREVLSDSSRHSENEECNDDSVIPISASIRSNPDFTGEIACRNMLMMIRLQRGEVLYTMGQLSAALSDLYSVLGSSAARDAHADIAGAGAQLLVKCRALSCQAALFVLIGVDQRAEQSLEELNATIRQDNKRIEEEFRAGINGRASLASALAAKHPTAPTPVSAAEWHRARRMAILHEHPQVRALALDRHSNGGLSLAIGIVAMSMFHFVVAWCVGVAISGSDGGVLGFLLTSLAVLGAAASVGAVCAYGIQALIHELSHQVANKKINFVAMCTGSALCNFPWAMYYSVYHARHHAYTGAEKDRDGDILFRPWHSPPSFEFPEQLTWCILTARIFFANRFDFQTATEEHNENDTDNSQTTQRKPKKRGTRKSKAKQVIRVDLSAHWSTRLLWSVIFAFCIYPFFFACKLMFDTVHVPRMCFEGAMVVAHASVWWLSGSIWAPLYLQLSAAFSLGAFCHPYLGFWLIQHASGPRTVVARAIEQDDCEKEKKKKNNNNNDDNKNNKSDNKQQPKRYVLLEFIKAHHLHPVQPTVSYGGSKLWHILNFSELLHVEHHDFPRVPCFRASSLANKYAPEFYTDLAQCPSILGAIDEWLNPPSNAWWMSQHGDFAGRYAYLLAKRVRNEAHDTDVGVEFDSDCELEQDDQLVEAAKVSGRGEADDTLADMLFGEMLRRKKENDGNMTNDDESDYSE